MTTLGNLTNKNVVFIGLITEKQYIIILQSCSIVWTTLSLGGAISNVINIRTFIAMGLSDGITVTFLTLAIFDLAYLIVSFSLGVVVVFHVLELEYSFRFSIEPLSLCIYLFSMSVLINTGTTLIITFLAIARCMCVAKPLQFKNIFSRKLALIFNIWFILFATVSYTPIFTNMSLAVKFDPRINISRPVLWTSPNRDSVKIIVWIIVDIIVPFATQIIILICIIVLTSCLRAAVRFRQASTLTFTLTDKIMNRRLGELCKHSHPTGLNVPSENLTSKEVRVVQQVVLISVVYIICNIPKMIISVAAVTEREFTIGKAQNMLYICVNGLSKHFEIFNSAINLAIYYKYNTKFRAKLSIWCEKCW
uniref:G-protein coupled receptors family 1 profile domain-containing protein n=1 Tax=Arion vulgaris TaxID=1028688 RepID=A0A0B6ZK51_9EUPU